MLDEDEPITCPYEEYRNDPSFREVWGTPRFPPSSLALALAGLRTMPECNERNTLADTVWWDIADRVRISKALIRAFAALRPPPGWIPPPYSLAQHKSIRHKLEQWGWNFRR